MRLEISSTSISEATATIMIITANNDDQPTSCYQRLQNDRQIAATRGDGGLERRGEEEGKRMEGETWREVKGGGRWAKGSKRWMGEEGSCNHI